jgi:hypothetical protein
MGEFVADVRAIAAGPVPPPSVRLAAVLSGAVPLSAFLSDAVPSPRLSAGGQGRTRWLLVAAASVAVFAAWAVGSGPTRSTQPTLTHVAHDVARILVAPAQRIGLPAPSASSAVPSPSAPARSAPPRSASPIAVGFAAEHRADTRIVPSDGLTATPASAATTSEPAAGTPTKTGKDPSGRCSPSAGATHDPNRHRDGTHPVAGRRQEHRPSDASGSRFAGGGRRASVGGRPQSGSPRAGHRHR